MKIFASEKGFTLIEAFGAIFLGTFVLLSLATSYHSGVMTATENRCQIYALNALRTELETLRSTAYDTIVGYGSSSTFTNADVTRIPTATATRAIASSFGSDIKKVTLTVSWSNKRGTTTNKSITTYICRQGVNGA